MESLAIDIGNTAVKIGYFKNAELIEVYRWKKEELASQLQRFKRIGGIVASVANSESELKDIFSGHKNFIFLNQDTPLPIINKYHTPQTLGYDRLAAAVGANARFPAENCLVVDIGTAIKYDLVSGQAEFLGGIISPGREMRFKALHTFTKKLPLVNATNVPELIGTSTESCISSGVLNGIVAELNGIIHKYIESYNPIVLLCGGDVVYFETQIKYPTFAAPNLVLEGLNRILLYNVAKA